MAKSDTEEEEDEVEDGKDVCPLAEEEWLYHYMLTKCAEKVGPGGLLLPGQQKPQEADDGETHSEWVLRIISQYRKTADVLQAAGAKYPRKIVVYNKLPYLAVESIEVS